MDRSQRIELIIILGALSAFGALSIDMYLPSLPTLQRVFSTTSLATQLTLATFFIGFALGQLLVGPISDRFGRKRPLIMGLALYVISSLGCALAPSIHVLAALRFIQGLGACAGVVIARAVVSDLFPAQETPHVFARLMLVMGAAPVLAPLLGGYLLVFAGWQSIFWALAMISAGILLASATLLPESHPPDSTHSLALGAVMRRYAVYLRDGRFMSYSLATGFSFAGMFAYIAGSPFVFIELYHVPARDFGWLFGLNALGLVGFTQLNRRLHRYMDTLGVLRLSITIQALSGVGLALAAYTGFGGLGGLMAPLFFYVSGVGLVAANATALAMAPHAHNAGSASAMMGTLRFAIAALAASTVGALHLPGPLPMAVVIAACGLFGMGAAQMGGDPAPTRAG